MKETYKVTYQIDGDKRYNHEFFILAKSAKSARKKFIKGHKAPDIVEIVSVVVYEGGDFE